MSGYEIFGEISSEFLVAAREINVRLNQALEKEAGAMLCNASDKGDVHVVRLLIEKFPDQINAKDHDKDTPFILASNMGHKKIVTMLLEQPKIAINAQGNDGMTGFMHACDQGYTGLAKAIFERRADLDVTLKDRDGDTAIILAVSNKDLELVRLILQRKEVDVEAKNTDDESARSIATKFRKKAQVDKDIMALIAAHPSYRAKPPAPAQQAEASKPRRGPGRPRKTPTPGAAPGV